MAHGSCLMAYIYIYILTGQHGPLSVRTAYLQSQSQLQAYIIWSAAYLQSQAYVIMVPATYDACLQCPPRKAHAQST